MAIRDLTKRDGEIKIEEHVQFKDLLDIISAFIYIVDMKTYEILFVNKYAQEVWGDITGQKCWEVLQEGQIGPCEFCTNSKLLNKDGTPADVYTWEFENTKNNRWYECRDRAILWSDGRTVRFEIATDITGRKQTEEALQSQLKFEKMVAAISTRFANISEGKLDETIDHVLKLSGEFFNVDRSYLFQFSADGKLMDNTHEWCAPGIEPQIDNLQEIPAEAIPWWMEKLNSFEVINVYCVEDMPLFAAAEKEILKSQSIQSVLVVPMSFAGKLTGFIGFDSVEDKKLWKEEQISILIVLADIISNALVRQQREDRIKTISEENEKLFNGTQDAMFLIEVSGTNSFRYVRNNIALEKTTGLSDMSGKTPGEVFGDEIGSVFCSNYSRCVQAGEPIYYEENPVLPVGERFLVTTLTPVFQHGRVAYIVGSSNDITERKKAEKALRKSEQRLSNIIEFLPDATFVIDHLGKVIAWNRAMEEMTIVQEHKMLGRGDCEYAVPFYGERRPILIDLALMTDTELERLKDKYNHIQRDGDTLVGEVFVPKTYGGKGAYLSATASRLRDESGDIVGAIESIRDITDRKRAEEKLKESEEKYRSLVNQSLEMLFLHDLEGNFLEVNKAVIMQTGYSNDELLRMNLLDLLPDNINFDDIKRQWKEWPVGQPVTLEAKHKCKNGSVYPAEVTTGKVMIGDEKYILALVRDITERKQAEDRIRYISFHDSLTRLYNRAFLEEEMKRLDTVRQLPISIIMADLNGLKLVNDTYGHCTGDEMLQSAANILRSSCREEDIIARWGGDEFVILLPQTAKIKAEDICKRISDKCCKAYVGDVPISIALGVAAKNNAQENLAAILKEAEDNMYKQKLTESRSTRSGVLNALLKALAAKSYETEEHARRMLDVAQKIGEKIGLSDYDLNRLSLLVTLHDIGKINISEEILTKNSPLNEKEWEAIKKHPEIGFRIARATEEFAHIAEDILSHHERWDGSGYPRGLKGKEIPLLARIVAIADAYEVMSNGRPYKIPFSKEEIIAEYKNCSGTHFDPELVDVFLVDLC